MSVDIDFFFNHPDNLAALAERLNGWLGCALAPYEGDPEDLFGRFFGMEFSLAEHNLENDGERNFEDYKYELGFRTAVPDGDLRMVQLPAIAMIIYVLFRRMNVTGMLVYDVQIVLARYEARSVSAGGAAYLYDVLSNEFVSFPEHLAALQARTPNGSFGKLAL